METNEPIVRFEDITKKFPGVVALKKASLGIAHGTCHGLVGENGAGKSTLGKILAGIYPHEGGAVYVKGKPVRFGNPRDALRAGIGMVHQELSFCENMTVAENLCLEEMPTRGLFLDKKTMRERAAKMLDSIGANINVDARLGELSISQQQMIQIASTVGSGADIIVFDEPTSSLSQHEAERLFELIKDLRSRGVTSIYVSHRMKEIFQLCDAITVLRDGQVVGTKPIGEVDENSIVEMMIGRKLDEYFPAHLGAKAGEEVLRVEGFSSPGKFRDVSFSLHAGEVLGFAGLVGSGRTEIAEALFGLDRRAAGRIILKGKQVSVRTASEAVKIGLGLVPEDRKRHGLVLMMSSRGNLTLPILERFASLGWVKAKIEREVVNKYFKKMSVRAPGIDTVVNSLSGGNQQKIVLAKWLAAECGVLMLDEPTRGVDVGSKAEIHALIDQLAADGAGILLISSELPEVINLSTRILVLRNGRIVAEVPRAQAEQETLMRHMAGITSQAS
jgi:ABC-type sugar transport system ATPase subunit